jgi:hypothetical protein
MRLVPGVNAPADLPGLTGDVLHELEAVRAEGRGGVVVAHLAHRVADDAQVVQREVELISPASTTTPDLQSTSQATRLRRSCARYASRMESAMKSQTLSGWPSATDSEVRMAASRPRARRGPGRRRR